MAVAKKPTKKTASKKPVARTKSVSETITEKATEAIKMPISFKQFSKNPVIGTLFIVLIAIGYLYIDVRKTFTDQASTQSNKIEKLEVKDEALHEAVRKLDSSLSSANSKLLTLEQLGAIQNIK
jgi:hypothetical protein